MPDVAGVSAFSILAEVVKLSVEGWSGDCLGLCVAHAEPRGQGWDSLSADAFLIHSLTTK